ncbi:MAG TPA: hypothetical protein VM869_31520 [Enhygromyxa sp.]|nr:hypothetical protein [Enhygromyxa sp.]
MARKARLNFALSSALLVAIPLTQACTSEGEEQPPSLGAIGSKYLDYLSLVDEVDAFYCECGTQKGDFETVEECVAFFGGPVLPPLMAECYAATLDDLEEVREHVDCQESKYQTLVECISAAGCSGDLQVCEQQAYDNPCPDRGYDVDAALAEACLGYSLPPAFECGDGTKILPWFECDFATDCPDGSDEYADCPGAYVCEGGQVISQNWLCDGISDCSAGEDEANCP